MKPFKSRVFLTVLAVLLLAGVLMFPSPEPAAAETYGDWEYRILDGACEITKYKGTQSNLVIPETLDGRAVRYIGEDAFFNNDHLKSVKIPGNVQRIGDWAFASSNSLTSVTISPGVTSIGEFAFDGCTSLTEVTIPGTITDFGGYAFDGCKSLKTVVISEGVASIGESAFFECTSLTSVTIPGTVRSIGSNAFHGCSALSKAVINEGVSLIGAWAFENCTNLASIKIPDSVTELGNGVFYGCTGLKEVVIPGKVTGIGNYVFSGCERLTEIAVAKENPAYASRDGVLYDKQFTKLVCWPGGKSCPGIPGDITGIAPTAFSRFGGLYTLVIPGNITDIGNYAFWSCENLLTVEIPASVVRIGESPFSNCKKLSKITVSGGNPRYSSPDGVLCDDQAHTLIGCPGKKSSVDIPYGTTRIGRYACYGCKNLTSVVIPGSVTVIDEDAFGYCEKLAAITIPASVTSIGDYAFYSCKSLRSVTIPGSVGTVGEYSFYKCSGLTDVIIQEGVTSIGDDAFAYTDSMKCLSIPASVTYFGEIGDAFWGVRHEGTDIGKIIFVPCTSPAAKHLKDKYWFDKKVALVHECNTGRGGVKPTCTQAGRTSSAGNTCSRCGKTIENQGTIPALGHMAVADRSVLPNCTQTGLTEGSHCSVCGETIVRQQTIAALGHTPVTDAAVAPTCTKAGRTEGSHCSVCGKVLTEQKEVPAAGHTAMTDAAVAPTCTKAGLTEGSHCSVCGEVLSAQKEVPAAGHTAVTDAAVAPTCTKAGRTEGSHCSVCGKVLSEQKEIPAAGHTAMTDAAVAPTCTKAGRTEGSHCSVCGKVLTEQKEVPAAGHTPVTDAAVAPTCTKAGRTEGSHCSVCGEVLSAQKEIPAAGHTPVTDAAVAPTDVEPGLTEGSHCSVCGAILIPQEAIPPRTWTTDVSGKLCSIVRYHGSDRMVTIPEEIEGRSVVAVMDGAFSDSPQVEMVFIPDSVKYLGPDLFSGDPVIYCTEYSDADIWAFEHEHRTVYTDDAENGDFYVIELPEGLRIEYGRSQDLDAIVFPILKDTRVEWSSSNESAATVADGKISAIAPGITTITARAGSVTKSTEVAIYGPARDFSVSPSEMYIVQKSRAPLTITRIVPEGADVTFRWRSSSEVLVKVDQNGLVTALRLGDAVISVTSDNGISHECLVHVCEPVTSVLFDETEYTLSPGRRLRLTARVTMGAQHCENQLVAFASSDETVATVDAGGTVTAVGPGTATITAAAANGVSASCVVIVE